MTIDPVKQIRITYSEFVSVAIHSACATFSHQGPFFSEKTLLNKMCVLGFYLQLLSETFLILRITKRDTTVRGHS